MTHTTLKVFVEMFTPEPGGTVTCRPVKNEGDELKRHTFPAGVVKDFSNLVHYEATVSTIDVRTDYVARHGLFQTFTRSHTRKG